MDDDADEDDRPSSFRRLFARDERDDTPSSLRKSLTSFLSKLSLLYRFFNSVEPKGSFVMPAAFCTVGFLKLDVLLRFIVI